MKNSESKLLIFNNHEKKLFIEILSQIIIKNFGFYFYLYWWILITLISQWDI